MIHHYIGYIESKIISGFIISSACLSNSLKSINRFLSNFSNITFFGQTCFQIQSYIQTFPEGACPQTPRRSMLCMLGVYTSYTFSNHFLTTYIAIASSLPSLSAENALHDQTLVVLYLIHVSHRLACTSFLKTAFICEVGMCVCVFVCACVHVCVSTPEAVNN